MHAYIHTPNTKQTNAYISLKQEHTHTYIYVHTAIHTHPKPLTLHPKPTRPRGSPRAQKGTPPQSPTAMVLSSTLGLWALGFGLRV